ncbi:SDR family NAD(P)-dependent oxidoreductase [Marinobacter zhanjiangensis]|uniref:Dihydromonapterin reductase n=1 Tax=Marinobacter zhanjiangensis TaxID=578215 RepID=A0ABQ3B9W8_9GAMM|nr:SDR family NAD(P)-dependent oxidoreductase [Marinobacter zhanjiangensis]GGY85767.1 pteridine reductase 1 [Marinobacter zhanjiangensis]
MTTPVAVITGAGRRLGFYTCQALLDLGYRVFALYRTTTGEIDQLAARGATPVAVDLADPASVDQALVTIRTRTPEVHLLVNNASEFTADEEEEADLARQAARLFQINSIAPMMLMAGLSNCLRAGCTSPAEPTLVVNITDIFVEKPNPTFAAYCASKAALSNLTLSYARSLAPEVRVNAIMPGPIGFLPDHTEEEQARVLSETLLAREGGFDSVVQQIIALLDNQFMTGALIPVDGGRRLA